MSQEHRFAARACALLVLATSVCGLGCDGEDSTDGERQSSSGGTTSTPEAPESFGPPGSGFVTAGGTATNSRFTLVFTVGQSTQNQETMTSPRHRLQGGVIGANESLP